jgi:DNA ligase-1|tara:strand:- start:13664 stop:14794 length:1131 start_codon:yes stop_codon:yes gene_type:complete
MTVVQEHTLYKKDSKGKIRSWRGWVAQGTSGRFLFYVETGLLHGNKTRNRPKIIYHGKQKRDAKQQAVFQLDSKRNKKRDEGYFDTINEAQTITVMRPMLALDFNQRGHDIHFPAVGQRKFDGVRCLASIEDNGEVSLKSRKGKEFPHMNHLRQQIAGLKDIPDGGFLDGELYSDTLTFQEVVGLVRRETLNAGDEDKLKQISYRLYDIYDPANPSKGFADRYNILVLLAQQFSNKPNLILTENIRLENPSDVEKYHEEFVKEGYEGIMVRNNSGEYGLNRRSKNLQKYKKFFDQEFEIVGYYEGTGNDRGTVIWECMTEDGQIFKARPKGTREQRTLWFDTADSYIGSTLTVRYFEMTDDGVPRFPVGLAIRDYE